MFTIATLTALLGWMSVINIAVLVLSAIALLVMQDFILKLHSKLFGLDEQDLQRAYFQYLAQYKIAIWVLNIAPYLALRIIG